MKRPIRVLQAAGAFIAVAALVAACSGSSGSSRGSGAKQTVLGATQTAAATPASNPTAEPSLATARPSLATARPTTLDPCQLVTSQEASALAGATFGPGKPETTSGNGKMCTYGYQTLNVFMVIVAQAPDAAALAQAEAQAQSEVTSQAPGTKITQLSGLGDKAVFLSGGGSIQGQTLNVSAIYVVKGLVFFGFSDLKLNAPAPSQAQMSAEAALVLARLP